jgi:hypothetical protein
MYIQGDTLILLKDEGDELLACCEGEVGWVKRQNISLDAMASGSAPSSPEPIAPPSLRAEYDVHVGYDSNTEDEGGNTPVMHSATWDVMGDSSGAEDTDLSAVIGGRSRSTTPRRYSPTASGSSHSSQQHSAGSAPIRPRRSSGRPAAAAVTPSPPQPIPPVIHSRNYSDTSTSTHSSASSEPIGHLVLGGFTQHSSPGSGSDCE